MSSSENSPFSSATTPPSSPPPSAPNTPTPTPTKKRSNKRRAGKKEQEKKPRRQNQLSNTEHDLQSRHPLYELRDAGSKGLGLFATQDIQIGERIIQEKPLLIATIGAYMDEDIIDAFFELPPADQESFLSLCSHETCLKNSATSVTEADPTNPIALEIDASKDGPLIDEYGIEEPVPEIQECSSAFGTCKRPETTVEISNQSSDQDSKPTHSHATGAPELDIETNTDEHYMHNNEDPVTEYDDLNQTLACRIIDTFRTNSYVLDDGGALETSGICRVAARLNHSCIPNVYCAYNSQTGNLTVHATQAIAAGDELCTSYINGTYKLQRERQQELSKWGFECGCVACSADAEPRRQELKILMQKSTDARTGFSSMIGEQLAHTAKLLQRMTELMREEGLLSPELADVCFGAAACYARIGCGGQALALQNRRLELMLNCYGPDSPVFLQDRVVRGS